MAKLGLTMVDSLVDTDLCEEQGLSSAHSTHLVLWGHTLADYQEMFDLSDADLQKKIIDCGGGPASVNAELTAKGGHIVSSDELYALKKADLENHVADSFQAMLAKVRVQQDHFVWDGIESLDALSRLRQHGINHFFKDFEQGKADKRYCAASITALPFDDGYFDIALCSHYLFGHRAERTAEYYCQAIMEMARVAKEVRIFPLLDGCGELSPLVNPTMLALQQQHMGVEVRQVPYQFQKQGNAMLRVWAQECRLP